MCPLFRVSFNRIATVFSHYILSECDTLHILALMALDSLYNNVTCIHQINAKTICITVTSMAFLVAAGLLY